jgi:cytoskeletal protein RodZ
MALSICCQACAAEFSVDEKLFERRVAGKVARFKCSACGQLSTINAVVNKKPDQLKPNADVKGELADKDFDAADEEIAEISDEEVASLPPSSLPKIGRPPPRPRLESKVDDELWVVNVKEGQEDQEIFESSLIDQIAAGKVVSDAIVWKEGMTDWLALANVPELAKHLPRPTAPEADKTGGLFGTGMATSFGSNSGERKSAPPPLPPKKRSYGSANKKSHGQKSGGSKPVALSPGFLFSVDDARSEPPEALLESAPKAQKAAPKPPLRAMRRAVTRDLDFSDIEGEDVPLSGTPALKDLTTVVKKGGRPAAQASDSLASLGAVLSLGAVEEEVLSPPSIDISDIAGDSNKASPAAGESAVKPASTPAPRTAPASSAAPSPSTASSEAPPTSRRGNKKRKRKKAGASKRPSARPPASAAPTPKPESRRPKSAQSHNAEARVSQARQGWFTPGKALVLVAIAGLAYFLFSRQLHKPTTETSASEPEKAVQQEPRDQAPALEQRTQLKEAPTESPEPSGSQQEDAVAQQARPPQAKNAASAPGNEPQANAKQPVGEAQAVSAREVEPAPEPKEEPRKVPPPAPPSNADAPPFNKAAAVGALNSAVGQASGCRQQGDPTGTARVVITFAPSGRVTSANLSGPPFAGTRTGGCIAATMRRAKVPPFSGGHVTVSKSVVIR